MQIQSFSQPNILQRPRPSAPRLQSGDGFRPGLPGPGDLIPNRLIQSGGGQQALRFAGIGVMFGGILASTNLPSSWVGVGIIGSMCAGVALMSLANQ